ncbi:MAG: putative metalloprotease CJM1_0395 family protein [Planctomycetota bacterium]
MSVFSPSLALNPAPVALRTDTGVANRTPSRPDGPGRASGVAPNDPKAQNVADRPTHAVTLSPEAQQAANNSSEIPNGSAATSDNETSTNDSAAPKGKDGEPLDESEQKQVEELQARDREVRQHEQAHKAAAGQYATSGPTYSYQEGPDGKRYAVGGSVGIDASPEATPEETIAKMQVVRRAALAPAEPSSQDRKVAAQASRTEQQARAELAEQRTDEPDGDDAANANPETTNTSANYNSSIGKLETSKPIAESTFDVVA